MDRTLSLEVHQLFRGFRAPGNASSHKPARSPRETETRALTSTRQQHFLIAPAQNSRNAEFLMRAVLLRVWSTITSPPGMVKTSPEVRR